MQLCISKAKKLHEELAELVSTAEELVKALGEKSKEMDSGFKCGM